MCLNMAAHGTKSVTIERTRKEHLIKTHLQRGHLHGEIIALSSLVNAVDFEDIGS